MKPEKVFQVIIATAVHTICSYANDNVDDFEDIPEEVDEAVEVVQYNIAQDQNTATRDALIATVFV